MQHIQIDFDLINVAIYSLAIGVCRRGLRSVMLTKDTASSSAAKVDALPFVNWGQERTEAALALQKDLLAAYEEASRTWLARIQSEVALWSDLATKLAGTRTVPEALEVYARCV